MTAPGNLIIFQSDNHNRDLLGCYGHPVVQTPNLDRIAANGARFDNAYCTSSLCCPSRASLATGLYPHQTGFWMKNTTLPLSIAYIDRERRIAEIHNLQPGNTNTVESRSRQIMYALEVNQGWFSKNGIKPGNVISTESGPLSRAVRSR